MLTPEASSPIIPTENSAIVLKKLTLSDAEPYFQAFDASREHMRQFEPKMVKGFPDLVSVRQSILEPINPEKLSFGIWAKGSFAGSISVTPCPDRHEDAGEIGYWLDKRHTGKGYATIAVRALTVYAAECYRIFCARVKMGNVASMRVLDRAGFQRSEITRIGNYDFQMFNLSPHKEETEVE